MVTMERPIRATLRLWFPGMDKDDDYRVDRQIAKVKFLLGHRGCCLVPRRPAGSCNGHRFEDAGIAGNYRHGASFESAADTIATLDAAFDALNYRLKRGALCLIKRGSKHLAADGKFTPGVAAVITWGQLGKFYGVRKETLKEEVKDATEAMALMFLDWVKVELPSE